MFSLLPVLLIFITHLTKENQTESGVREKFKHELLIAYHPTAIYGLLFNTL